jgi:hypothetical protein
MLYSGAEERENRGFGMRPGSHLRKREEYPEEINGKR